MRVRNVFGVLLIVGFLAVTGLYEEPIAVLAFGALALGVLCMKPEDKGRLF